MVKHETVDLDMVFAALSHAARRDTLDRLGRGACTVSDLAGPHGMSLAGFMKHVGALEAAGLIACAKQGRTVTCTLAPRRAFRRASEWMSTRERLWNARLDALGAHLSQNQPRSPSRKSHR
jgi:DNA-binding transcriptional ArsR family regulator